MKFLIVFFLFSIYSINAQNIDCPKSLIIGDFDKNEYQIMYPFGWSEGGYFAYILQDMNQKESADYTFKVIVQNMKTDSIAWSKDIIFNYDDNPNVKWECDSNPSVDSASDYIKKYNYCFLEQILWPKYKEEVEIELKKYNISINSQVLIQSTELLKNKIKIDEIKTVYDDYCVDKYEIILKENEKIKKIVFSNDSQKNNTLCGSSNQIWYRNFSIKGYFKSPFEDRVAIVVFETTNGYEETFETPFLVGAKF